MAGPERKAGLLGPNRKGWKCFRDLGSLLGTASRGAHWPTRRVSREELIAQVLTLQRQMAWLREENGRLKRFGRR